jgi:arylsulfatase A-like enzyme
MKTKLLLIVLACFGMVQLAHTQETSGTPGSPGATTTTGGKHLPLPDAPFGGEITTKATDSTPYWPPRVVPPKGAPNVLLIMTDDAGFAAPATFGGVIPTPALDRIANSGLRYTNFHSTSLCSPTRAALITGRNHHAVGFGVVGEVTTGFPGYDSLIVKANGTIGNILKLNGYATSWFGKNHNTPSYQSTAAGPFDQWPMGMGFEYFYGFMGGDTSQWQPNLYRNTTPIYPFEGKEPGTWNLTTEMASEAIQYMQDLKAVAPEKPFLVYYVPGGTHSPHHPTEEWIKKISDMKLFEGGWNQVRETIFANQQRLGIMPENAVLTDWPDTLPQWESLGDLEKDLFIRQMNVYAAYLAYTDHEIGRVIQAVEDLGELDNTLIIYISGDNGASAEGMLNGTPNEFTTFNGVPVPVKAQMLWYPFWGSDKTFPHHAASWAWAMSTPFQWVKQVASHYGGTAQGLAMSWPGHITDVGGIRDQFHHMIDITPTILEAVGLPQPETINGVAQRPMDGVSMAYTWDKPGAERPSERKTQYFETLGNRAIYHEGWVAATTPATIPWVLSSAPAPDVITGYQWELYNVAEDPTQSDNLAARMPDKLKEMQDIFYAEAALHNVLPLDNRTLARWNAPKPSLTEGRTEFVYTAPVSGIPGHGAPSTLNRAYTITAEVTIPKGGAEGMIVTQGGRFGGYGLFLSPAFNWWGNMGFFRNLGWGILVFGLLLLWHGRSTNWKGFKLGISQLIVLSAAFLLVAVFTTNIFNIGGGKPVFLYNLLNLKRTIWSGPALGEGTHTIVFDYKPDEPGLGKSGKGTLSVNGKEVDTNTMKNGTPITYPEDESFDIGSDTRTGVAMLKHRYDVPFRFTGEINKLTFKLVPIEPISEPKAELEPIPAPEPDPIDTAQH